MNFVQKIEPGLELSEAFYSLTYVVLFAGYTISAVVVGLLFNLIPTWYLLLVSTVSLILGYLLYALAINGWMMLVARGLAGLSYGAVTALTFAYFGVSYEKYVEDLKILGEFEENRAAKMKGYIFSSEHIGYALGNGIAVGTCQHRKEFSSNAYNLLSVCFDQCIVRVYRSALVLGTGAMQT